MEVIVVVGGVLLVVWIARRIFGSSVRPSPTNRSRSTAETQSPTYRSPPSPKPDTVYRPTTRRSPQPKIVFQEAKSGPVPSGQALAGLHDAFTGAPLDVRLGLHQCTTCKVYYHADSVVVLRAENAARCVACGGGSIVALSEGQARTSKGRDYSPDVVTLINFRSHFDRVVTFEGRVQSVKVSRRGSDFAVMFENATWTAGLKLVFFRGAVRTVGGPEFIKALNGRKVRVRGLLINHNRFGPEIIISERGMILGVTP
jgi:hypothetical protein